VLIISNLLSIKIYTLALMSILIHNLEMQFLIM
jgi:hypothetical protein